MGKCYDIFNHLLTTVIAINIDIFHRLMQVKFCAAERSVEPPASEMWHSQISIPKCLWYSNAIVSVVFVKI